MPVDVTVVIAARDEEQFVEEAVRSVAQQQGPSVELVFVDDASKDRTFEIVTALTQELPNIRVVRNPKPGKCAAFNYGVSLAQGQFVCIFAGDDIMPEGSLATRWQAVKGVRSDRPVIGLCRLVSFSEDKRFDGVVVPKNPNRGGLTGVSYLMSRRAVEKMFPVPETLPNEDTWLETAAVFMDMELVHSGVIGCKWRVHSGNSINMTVPFEEFNRKLTPRMAAYQMFLDRHGVEMSERNRILLQAKAKCEDARKSGSVAGILLSGATMGDKLRAVSLSTPLMYTVRRRLFSLLSGW